MVRFDWIWPEKAERGRKSALIAASVALHVTVLGYLALKQFEAPPITIPRSPVTFIPVELVPVPRDRHPGRHAFPPHQARTHEGRQPTPPPSAGRRPDAAAQAAPVPSGMGVAHSPPTREDRWGVRPAERGAIRPRPRDCVIGGVRRDLSECTNWISAAPDDPATGRSVRVGARTRSAAEQRRQIDFENQIAYNEAMRRFRAGEGPYPGLLNALKYQ